RVSRDWSSDVCSSDLLNALYARSRSEGFGPEVKRRILLGTYALSAGFYDAYYVKAQKVRTLIRGDFDQAFQKVDVLMGPTSPVQIGRAACGRGVGGRG